MPVSEVTPVGTDWGVQVVPPFDVEMIAGPGPSDDVPIAVQWSTSEHEMALKLVSVAGIESDIQIVPPSVVRMMLGTPVSGSKVLTA
jgi:hypothetical protein